jgi:hypothetical protein
MTAANRAKLQARNDPADGSANDSDNTGTKAA